MLILGGADQVTKITSLITFQEWIFHVYFVPSQMTKFQKFHCFLKDECKNEICFFSNIKLLPSSYLDTLLFICWFYAFMYKYITVILYSIDYSWWCPFRPAAFQDTKLYRIHIFFLLMICIFHVMLCAFCTAYLTKTLEVFLEITGTPHYLSLH